VSSVALTLADDTADANASIARLEQQYDFVIVQLPSLTSNAAAATLQPARPVLLVTSDRVDRRQLLGSVQLLKRLNVPCAGIVMTRRLAGKVMPNERALEG
jgi:Mrp family chromosome partitioning ATPase